MLEDIGHFILNITTVHSFTAMETLYLIISLYLKSYSKATEPLKTRSKCAAV